MFLLVKLGLVTCAFYLGIVVLLEGAIFGIGIMSKGGFGYFLTRPAWFVLFGMIWLLSFSLAWRIVMTPLTSRFSR